MSGRIRAASIAGTATLAAVACAALALLTPHASTSSGETRIIRLVIRDMAYHVEGRSEPNPTLHLHRGERVQVIVNNGDAGMKHDFGVDAWQARTRVIDGIGEARLDFVAPASAGEAVYSCAPHGAMMHGTIRIE